MVGVVILIFGFVILSMEVEVFLGIYEVMYGFSIDIIGFLVFIFSLSRKVDIFLGKWKLV